MRIKLEDLNQSGRGPLYIKDRQRLATVTSVKFMDSTTIACCSFVGRRMYAIRFDLAAGSHEVLDSIDTVFAGATTETDLCNTDGNGNIVTSNFYLGSSTQYRYENGRLRFVRDLPFALGNFVHGIHFYRPDIIAITVTRGPTGVHFIHADTMERLLHIATEFKTQDVCFLSDSRLVMLTTRGSPTSVQHESYYSDLHLVEYDLGKKTFRIASSRAFESAHFDCIVQHDGALYVTDQFNDQVLRIDAADLSVKSAIGGYDFPHGIDIRFGQMAVTNYGSNCVDIRAL